MDLTADAIERLVQLGRESAAETVEIGGVEYSTTPLFDAREKVPEPDVLTFRSLSGLIDYVESNRDGLDPAELSLHVVGPSRVDLIGTLKGYHNQRFRYAKASAVLPLDGPGGFNFGHFYDLEEANIKIQSQFVDVGDRADVLKLIGRVTDEELHTRVDDGVTQEVTAKSGLSTVERTEVPNPVWLAPYRTFSEVTQPESPFISRLRKGRNGPEFALFEADGGSWRNDAMQSIADHLGSFVGDPVRIIA